MPPPGKTVKVYVFENDGEFRVHPALIELNGDSTGGDDIEFVNNTDEDLVFFFRHDLFDNDGFAEAVKKKGKKTTSKKAKSQGNGNVTVSAYQVLMMPSGKKAKANSDPVIIIEN
jgi:hypothetical protein